MAISERQAVTGAVRDRSFSARRDRCAPVATGGKGPVAHRSSYGLAFAYCHRSNSGQRSIPRVWSGSAIVGQYCTHRRAWRGMDGL